MTLCSVFYLKLHFIQSTNATIPTDEEPLPALTKRNAWRPQVNATGVMPVIFSTTLLSLPTGLAKYAAWLEPVAAALGPTGLLYLPVSLVI